MESEEIGQFISTALPTLEESEAKELLDRLIGLGIESARDLTYLKEGELTPYLKPIQARKFLMIAKSRFRHVEESTEHNDSNSESRHDTTSPTTQLECLSDSLDSDSSRASTPASSIEVAAGCSHWSWAKDFKVNWGKMPARLKASLKSKQRPSAKDRREMIRILCDDIDKTGGHVGRKELATVSQKIVLEYPESFRDGDVEKVIGSGYDSLLFQIENRIYNMKRKSTSTTTTEICREQKRARKENYGCTKWSPPLPDKETVESQEKKRDLLKRQYSTKEGCDREEIVKYMKETYPSQRKLINRKSPPLFISDILQQWPFLRDNECLLAHFEELTGISADNFDEALTGRNKGHRLYQYFQTYRSKNKGIARWCDKVDEAVCIQKSVYPQTAAILPLLMAYFGEKEDGMMKVYEESASQRDVEADDIPPNPFIAVIGDPFGKAAYVLIEKTVFTEDAVTLSVDSMFSTSNTTMRQEEPWSLFRGASLESIHQGDQDQPNQGHQPIQKSWRW